MTHFSLFTGIGGLDLAAEWAGFETVGQCEWADYPTKVLEKHWPDVPRWRDIRSVTADSFFERTGLHTVDIISGGFPCQPFSVAGKQRGKDDDRYLWPEMLRVISELRPSWVIGENVAGIVNMALDTVLSELEALGYTVQAFIIPACAVDARHRRDRVFIVAHATWEQRDWKMHTREWRNGLADGSLLMDDALFGRHGISKGKVCPGRNSFIDSSRRSVEPDVGRVAHGIPSRVDRLKCLGNAVVPQQAYPIFKAIAEIECL